MVIYGQQFEYSEVRLTDAQKRVARCRAEAAQRGRQQARLWALKRQAPGQGHGQPQHGAPSNSRREGHVASSLCYLGDYFIIQFLYEELCKGALPQAQFIA